MSEKVRVGLAPAKSSISRGGSQLGHVEIA